MISLSKDQFAILPANQSARNAQNARTPGHVSKDMAGRVRIAGAVLWLAVGAWLGALPASAQDYQFDGSISKPVLENYLSRAITMVSVLQDDLSQPRNKKGVDPRDNIRMILNIKAKFIGRSVRVQGGEKDFPETLKLAKQFADAIHKGDPDIILEGGVFEVITPQVETISVPKYVLEAFGQPVTDRKFIYDQIAYPPEQKISHEGRGVPDMNRVEAQMWFYYVATSFIDVGIEAMHFGQVGLMDKNDRDHKGWINMLTKVREYAHTHARRHFILCNAHENHGGLVEDGKLLFDFHEKPLRIVEVPGHMPAGGLQVGYADSIYQDSRGGITPSGWKCDHLPYLVEFDNFGGMMHEPGGHASTKPFIWGWDEITWFGLLPEKDRDAWLVYAWKWLKENDPEGHLEMPGARVMDEFKGVAGPKFFWANIPSPACPEGSNLEPVIKAIWAADTPKSGK
jgi:hypothetical protein